MSLKVENSLLEYVDSYEYLCFELKYNNDVSHVVSDRASKARRVTRTIIQAISNTYKNVPPRLSLNFFDTQIVPIAHRVAHSPTVWVKRPPCGKINVHFMMFTDFFREKCPFKMTHLTDEVTHSTDRFVLESTSDRI